MAAEKIPTGFKRGMKILTQANSATRKNSLQKLDMSQTSQALCLRVPMATIAPCKLLTKRAYCMPTQNKCKTIPPGRPLQINQPPNSALAQRQQLPPSPCTARVALKRAHPVNKEISTFTKATASLFHSRSSTRDGVNNLMDSKGVRAVSTAWSRDRRKQVFRNGSTDSWLQRGQSAWLWWTQTW